MPARYAVLFRGEAYRWGCTNDGVAIQLAAMKSHLAQIIEPLERLGHIVRLFFSHDHRVCKASYVFRPGELKKLGALGRNASNVIYKNDSPEAIDALTGLFLRTNIASISRIGGVKDQPDSIIGSLDLFLRRKRTHVGVGGSKAFVQKHSLAPRDGDGPETFDYLIITRYDVKFLSPMPSWPCFDKPLQVSLASQCEPGAWARFNCVADHFWIIPRPYISRAATLIGTRLNLSHYTKCCFAKRCLQKAGHGCYNVLSHHLGSEHVGFCWPQPAKSVAEPNPHYQCCRHGGAMVTAAAT